MAQSPGAKLRETIAGVVAIGSAVSDTAKALRDEASARAAEVIKAGEANAGSAGQQPGT